MNDDHETKKQAPDDVVLLDQDNREARARGEQGQDVQVASAVSSAQPVDEGVDMERELRRSEKEARGLSTENQILSEIGRIISSSLDVNQVYKPFADKVHQLIPFDRIVVMTVDLSAR